MNCCRFRHGRSSVATAGRGYPNSIWTRSSWNQQSKSAWSHRFTTGGNSTCKVGGYTRPTFARTRESDDSHHLDLRCHRLQGEPHPSGMSQRVVMWCTLIIALRQATKRKSDPQNGWRTSRVGGSGGSLVSWIIQNTVPFRNCTQPNRTGNLSLQADVH